MCRSETANMGKIWNFDFLALLCHGGTIKGACV